MNDNNKYSKDNDKTIDEDPCRYVNVDDDDDDDLDNAENDDYNPYANVSSNNSNDDLDDEISDLNLIKNQIEEQSSNLKDDNRDSDNKLEKKEILRLD